MYTTKWQIILVKFGVFTKYRVSQNNRYTMLNLQEKKLKLEKLKFEEIEVKFSVIITTLPIYPKWGFQG